MNSESKYRRLNLLAFLLVTAFCALGYRLVDLQVRQHAELSARADDNIKRSSIREPRRGEIWDIHGKRLAASVFVKTICADPTLIGDRQEEVARILAPRLQMDEAELIKKLQNRVIRYNEKGEPVHDQYVVLKRKVRRETWEQIQAAMTQVASGVDMKGVSREEKRFYRNLRTKAVFPDRREDQLRVFPNVGSAAHVLGYVRTEEDKAGHSTVFQTKGLYGIERTFDEVLDGTRGWREFERDSRGRELVRNRRADIAARPGDNVVLTIDAGLQYIVESELKQGWKDHTPLSATAIAVRPRTGEILAMATFPNFDPHHPGLFQLDALRNRAVTDMYEPGSTFKIVVVAGALNDRLVSLADRFHCENGSFRYAGRTLHDHHGYGMLSVEEIITKSSNIGAAKIGIKMGKESLHKYIMDFGFGEKTEIPLPAEARGTVHPVKRWGGQTITSVPMGHEISVTPLQLVMAMSAIANDGVLMKPMIVDHIENGEGKHVRHPKMPGDAFLPTEVRRAVSPRTAKMMVQALKTVPRKNGTAPQAALEHYTVAGKTGTAQKVGVVGKTIEGKDIMGYKSGAYFASFCGFFPADDPELCILVLFDEPKHGYYGGTVAGPVFQRIARRAAKYLNIPPEPQLMKELELTGLAYGRTATSRQ